MAQATKALMFMVCIVAAATVISASGLSASLGVGVETGLQDDVKDTNDGLQSYSAANSNTNGDFVTGLFSGIGKVFDSYKMLFKMGELLKNLGLPWWAVSFLVAPVTVIFGLFVVYLLTGRRTTSRL